MKMLKNVTLELSLKPFVDLRPQAVRDVCKKLFRQWDALIRRADGVSVMLWSADGSEILDYPGDMNAAFEWAKYIGIANPRGAIPNDPEGVGLHSRPYLYHENAPVHTYATLAEIVKALHEVGSQMTGKPTRVGATFDPGGEFAKSLFKYERHPEICMANTMGHATFVCCYATLNADDHRYAGFPDGIPQGTSLGTFLGRQSKHFLADLGFDYLWLSNGFGFGMETWLPTGPLFDGKTFNADQAPAIREQVLKFWRDFRAELPVTTPIEVRGTNLGTGADLATDAVPLREIYHGNFNVATPPNSPWAAINGDFGIELVGYMTRIAELPPGKGFPFRFYVHDPWWANSPWLDRYGREPHDIYLPSAIARINDAGRVETADTIEILTADDSYGRMPDTCPNEVTPHLLAGVDDRPDAPGLLTWVYPFDEFHDWAVDAPDRLPLAFFNDWFMRSAITDGLPMNTVVTSTNFIRTSQRDAALYGGTVIVTLVPDGGSALESAVFSHLNRGGAALLYGPVERASDRMLKTLGIKPAAALDESLDLQLTCAVDECRQSQFPARIVHRSLLSAGPIAHAADETNASQVRVLASAGRADDMRPIAICANTGKLGYVRGSNTSPFQQSADADAFTPGEMLLRLTLKQMGVTLGLDKTSHRQRHPALTVSRHCNALFFSGYVPDTRMGLRWKLPGGAPLLIGCDAELTSDGCAVYRMPRAFHRECRVLVEQSGGAVTCNEGVSVMVGVKRRLHIAGLQNATVRFLTETGCESQVTFEPNPTHPHVAGPWLTPTLEQLPIGPCLTVTNVTGPLLISW